MATTTPPPATAINPRALPALLTWLLAAVVLVLIVALIVVKFVRGTTPPGAVVVTPADPTVVAAATSVPTAALVAAAAAPTPVPLQEFTPRPGQPLLTASVGSHRLPEVLYVGSEYCPACAAERWALVVALSRFGTFHHLGATTSSPTATPGPIDSFSFSGATYTSTSLAFHGYELYGATADALGAYPALDHLGGADARAVRRLAPHGMVLALVSLANQAVLEGSQYSPTVLVGRSRAVVAGALGDPTSAATVAILASADHLTTELCRLTAETPASVCHPDPQER